MRRTFIAIFVVLLVGLAGCSGVNPFADSSTDPPSTAPPAPESTDRPGSTTTQPISPDPNVERPAGWNETGVSDAMKAYDQHYSSLYSYTNFTREENWTFLEPRQFLHSVARIDQSSKQQHWNTTVTDSGTQLYYQEEYQKGNMLYLTNRSDPPTYNSTDRYTFDTYMDFKMNRRLGKSGPVYYAVWSATYSESERVMYDGETMFRYRSTELRNQSIHKLDFLPPIAGNMTVTEFNMTTIVDSDGLIRRGQYEITYTTEAGETYTRTGLIRFDVGETTVSEPAWVEEAKSS